MRLNIINGAHTTRQERARGNQPVHWFLRSKGSDIQQRMSVWVGLPKSPQRGFIKPSHEHLHQVTCTQQCHLLLSINQTESNATCWLSLLNTGFMGGYLDLHHMHMIYSGM